jgi:hypothetical protein
VVFGPGHDIEEDCGPLSLIADNLGIEGDVIFGYCEGAAVDFEFPLEQQQRRFCLCFLLYFWEAVLGVEDDEGEGEKVGQTVRGSVRAEGEVVGELTVVVLIELGHQQVVLQHRLN